MQRDVDRITLRGSMDVLRDRYCAKRRVLDCCAGCECAAARGNLNDAVRFALGESAQNGIGSSQRCDVGGGKGVASSARPVEYRAIGFVIGDWHGPSSMFLRLWMQCCLGEKRLARVECNEVCHSYSRDLEESLLSEESLMRGDEHVWKGKQAGQFVVLQNLS